MTSEGIRPCLRCLLHRDASSHLMNVYRMSPGRVTLSLSVSKALDKLVSICAFSSCKDVAIAGDFILLLCLVGF